MKTKYLSYAQAYALAQDYQYITGQEIGKEHKADLITVAPYSRILQWSFVRQLTRQPLKAITIQNPNGRYDVIIISRCDKSPGGFAITDLRTYLKAARIPFDFGKYQAIPDHFPVTELTCMFSLETEPG